VGYVFILRVNVLELEGFFRL